MATLAYITMQTMLKTVKNRSNYGDSLKPVKMRDELHYMLEPADGDGDSALRSFLTIKAVT